MKVLKFLLRLIHIALLLLTAAFVIKKLREDEAFFNGEPDADV